MNLNQQPTSSVCANFGHNFYRERTNSRQTEVIKCKECGITIEMNNQGDFENRSFENLAIHRALKQLFLIQNNLRIRSHHRIFRMP